MIKIKFMIITNRKIDVHFAVKLRNSEIERVNFIKFLGIYINDKLTFKTRTDILNKRVSSSVGLIFQISPYDKNKTTKKKNNNTTHTLVTLYLYSTSD